MAPVTKDDLTRLCHFITARSSENRVEILGHLKNINVLLTEKSDTDLLKNYAWLLENVLNGFSAENSRHLSKEILKEIDLIVHNGPDDVVFIGLIAKIESASDSIVLNHCVHLLELFLTSGRILELMWKECQTGNRLILHQDLLTLIASLPERMANKLKRENRDVFLIDDYVERLAQSLVCISRKVRDDLLQNKDQNVQFLGQLLGKLCQCGHGKLLWRTILKPLAYELKTDFVLSRVWEKILNHVPGNSCESVLVPLLTWSPCYGVVYRLLGESVLNDSKIKFLLTNKLLLHRFYRDTVILHSILGYVSKFEDVCRETLKNLIQVWSGAGYVKHTSYEQQLYISSAIVILVAFMGEKIGSCKSFLSEKIMQGVPHYLESGVERIRMLGMVLAEIITKYVTPTGEALKFEYEESEDSQKLKSLLLLPEEFCQMEELKPSPVEEDGKAEKIEESIEERMCSVTVADEYLDSDDDLEPYDLSQDKVKSKVQEPKYIRQCMEGFLVKDDPDTFEIAFRNAARIVRENPVQAKELAEEFVMIVLHTEDQYETSNFNAIYRDLMVALVCADPKRVSEKLCGEFYARNYNIRQRLDVLDALAQSAQELSKLNSSACKSAKPIETLPDMTSLGNPGEENWREIVNLRIEAKTRRFASKTKEILTTENKFGDVAGHFFFPLLYPESCDASVDIRGRDSVLLVRLLYTLGVVVHSAINTQIVPKMSRELLDFIWLFRAHSEVAVRRGVLFAITMVFLSNPSFTLLSGLENQVSECKFWLEHVLENDQDGICREMAKQGLLVLVDALKNK